MSRTGSGRGGAGGSHLRTVGTTLAMGLREYARTPVLLALFAFLPVYFVAVFASVAPADAVPVHLPGGGTATLPMDETMAVLMAPVVGALVVGISGLFLMRSAQQTDRRLVIAGAGTAEVVLSRFGLLAVVAVVEAAVTTAVLLAFTAPDHLLGVWAAILLGGLTYGMVGVLAGIVLDRLPGVYLMLFAPTLDAFLFQNPLTAEAHDLAPYMPGHYASDLVVASAFGSGLPGDALAGGLAFLGVVVVLAGVAFWRSARPA
ncbi:hypothetical protein [Haloarchaeobius amylolyticus]|uniref:hypothetical protein n=1 Tax=Haloarchaeobius amylolyticus TaxID=1198296 RepID=UPI00226FB1E6|nr:hypothetical protein [Haloarchaeobius amylolyticus]